MAGGRWARAVQLHPQTLAAPLLGISKAPGMRLEPATFAPEQLSGREKVESVSPSAQQANSGAKGLTALALLKATPPPT